MQIVQSEHPRPLNRLAIGPDGLVVAASGPPHSPAGIEAWDAVTGTRRWVMLSDRANIRYFAFVLGGTHLFVADSGTQRVFNVPAADALPVAVARTGWAFAGVAATGERAFVASDGEQPILRCMGLPDLRDRWRRDGGNEFRDPHTEFGGSVAVAPDGARLALFVRERSSGRQSRIVVHDTTSGARRTAIPCDPAWDVRALALSADGEKLIALTGARAVEVFDSATGTRAGELAHAGRATVTALAVHPHGFVACARSDGTVTLWDAEARMRLRTLDWRAGRLVSVAFSPDGALGAAGTEDGKVIVWDVDL